MDKLLSCDWGTSSFRLRLIAMEGLNLMQEVNSGQGIAATFDLWQEKAVSNQEEKRIFYLNIIREYIEKIENDQNISLSGVPLILSGMISSSIGMAELPYGNLPFNLDGSNARTAYFEADENFQHPVLLISGIKSKDDVMRGEETQLVGAIADKMETEEKVATEKIFIFPGTHSKHVFVSSKQVVDFKTYMTGEYFELLSNSSILKLGVEKNQDLQNAKYLQSFKKGVQDAVSLNLLHATFRVRTNDLFGKLTKKENYHYLSGLVIGTELKDLLPLAASNIYVCCSSSLKLWYHTALVELGLKDEFNVFSAKWSDEAVIRGQIKIYNQFKCKQ